jgi:hypothetical protein
MHDFSRPSPFPLMAWNWVPDDPQLLRRMKDNGLTLAGFATPAQLDMVHAAGLQAIVSDARVSQYDWRQVDPAQARDQVRSLVAEVGQHPAVFGYYLKDEPCADEFPGLGTVASLVREYAPGKWPYINLFPDYANARQLGAPSYQAHLDAFIQHCQPPIISYDNYSLMEREDVRPQYWTNLAAVSATAQRHGVPFWNIVLTVAHFQYRELTAADARFQAFTTLAYGGRGLSYFTYFAPQIGNYRMAPVDQFGTETATWGYLQQVNRQIAQLSPTLAKLRFDTVYHYGSVPPGSRGPSGEDLVIGLDSGPFLVGEFTHDDGSRYALVVNKSFHDSHWVWAKTRLGSHALRLVSPYTGKLVPFTGEQQVLAPGQGSLLCLSPAP